MPAPVEKAAAVIPSTFDMLRRQVRGAIAARLFWQGAAVVGITFWVGLLLDRLFEPSPIVRAVCLGGLAIVGAIWLCFRAAPRLLLPLSEETLLGLLQPHRPQQVELVSTGLDLLQVEVSKRGALQQAAIGRAASAAKSLQGARLVRRWNDSGIVWFAATLGIAAGVLILGRPELAQVYGRRLALAEENWPRRVELVAEGFQYDASSREWRRFAPRGEPAELFVLARVAAAEEPPRTVWSRGGIGKTRQLTTLTRIGDTSGEAHRQTRFRRKIESLDDDLVLSLRAGDASQRLRLIAAERPRLTDVQVTCHPPRYLQRQAIRFPLATLEAAPEGSILEIAGGATQPLARVEASNVDDAGQKNAIQVEVVENNFRAETKPAEISSTLTIVATDSRGIASSPLHVPIEVKPDAPPTVSLSLQTKERLVTRDAVLRFQLTVDDDHALARTELRIAHPAGVAAISANLPRTLPAAIPVDVDLLSMRSAPQPMRMNLQPGEQIVATAVASDFYDLTPREPSKSQPISIRVVTPAELMAQIGRSQAELRSAVIELRNDAERLAYQIDLGWRRWNDAEQINLARWSPDRVLDVTKLKPGVTAATDRAEAISQQLIDNRLNQPALVDRLLGAVVRPLRRIAKKDLQKVEQLLTAYEETDPNQSLRAAAELVEQIVAKLDEVAETLRTQEGYSEVVSLLRGLIQEQREVNDRTSRAKTENARRLLFD